MAFVPNHHPTPEKLDIDARFILANERTLLAWIRTSIAIEAGGVALLELHKTRSYFGLGILLLGGVAALIGYHRFLGANKAIREGRLPPSGIGPAVQVAFVVTIALAFSLAQLSAIK